MSSIKGYSGPQSLRPGEVLTLYVSEDDPKSYPVFRVAFFRLGTKFAPVAGGTPQAVDPNSFVVIKNKQWFTSNTGPQPQGRGGISFGWKPYQFIIPDDWTPGAHVAILIRGSQDGDDLWSPDFASPDGQDSKVLFVVRTTKQPRSAPILYKVSTFTFQAYNYEGDSSLYLNQYQQPLAGLIDQNDLEYNTFAEMLNGQQVTGVINLVTLYRPGGGTGGITTYNNNIDPYRHARQQTVACWDQPFIGWLEGKTSNGQLAFPAIDYCTDYDLHAEPNLLSNYNLLLSVGHDEYWSSPMRSSVETFVGGGGNVAFLSGNICYWHVKVITDVNGTDVRLANNRAAAVPNGVGVWWNLDSEMALTGVSWRFGGGFYTTKDMPTPYPNAPLRVQYEDHWIFDGIEWPNKGPGSQNFLGAAGGPEVGLVGYECDGTPIAHVVPGPQGGAMNPQAAKKANAVAVPYYVTGTPEISTTPENFVILGVAHLDEEWATEDYNFGQGDPEGHLLLGPAGRNVTMGLYTNRGVVFTAATCDWPRVLGNPGTIIDQITFNLITRLQNRGLHIVGPSVGDDVLLVEEGKSAFFSVDFPLDVGVAPPHEWQVSGATIIGASNSPTVEVRMPMPGIPITLSVTVSWKKVQAWGTRTVMPLSAKAIRAREFVGVAAGLLPQIDAAPLSQWSRRRGVSVDEWAHRLLSLIDLAQGLLEVHGWADTNAVQFNEPRRWIAAARRTLAQRASGRSGSFPVSQSRPAGTPAHGGARPPAGDEAGTPADPILSEEFSI